MLKDFDILPIKYQSIIPFPHYYLDNCLPDNIAQTIQNEILNIPDSEFDRYDNPFDL